MNAQQYHDRVLDEARTLVAQGYKIDDAIEQAHRRVQHARRPGPAELAHVVGCVMGQLTTEHPTRPRR